MENKTQTSPINASVKTPVGWLGITTNDQNQLTKLHFLTSAAQPSQLPKHQSLPFLQEVIAQIQQYFQDATFKFTLPLHFDIGTEFEQKVWHALTETPTRKTLTYGELAQKLNTSPRAIGNTCRKNPIPIIVPCHRILSATGLGGYLGTRNGQPITTKQYLLNHELIHNGARHPCG